MSFAAMEVADEEDDDFDVALTPDSELPEDGPVARLKAVIIGVFDSFPLFWVLPADFTVDLYRGRYEVSGL